MDDSRLTPFQAELETQCKFVLFGAQIVNDNVQGVPSVEGSSHEDEADRTLSIWFGIQGIVTSAANASKLLWGAGKNSSERKALHEARRPLRESVGVADSSPLNSRDVRNSFEHFDERLDTWYGDKDRAHVYAGRFIGRPISDMVMILANPQPTLKPFGHYDPSTAILTFWEKSMELAPVVAEAERIVMVLQDRRTALDKSIDRRDDLMAPTRGDSGWIIADLSDGWRSANPGSDLAVSYRRDEGRVEMRGIARPLEN